MTDDLKADCPTCGAPMHALTMRTEKKQHYRQGEDSDRYFINWRCDHCDKNVTLEQHDD